MTKEAKEAVERIKAEIAGQPQHNRWINRVNPKTGKRERIRQTSLTALTASDIVAACSVAKDSEIIQALKMGSEVGNPDREVLILTAHAGHLVEQAELAGGVQATALEKKVGEKGEKK
ncbi:MAG: hypothetical protein H0U85_01835 [Gemmatimonadales bacterium]|nr:hypothetical protein [Gemmatimonadales bacterium]